MPSGLFSAEAERALPYSRGLSGKPLTGPVAEGMAEYELLPWLVGALRVNYARMPAQDLTEAELFPFRRGGLGGGTSRTGYSQQQGNWSMLRTMAGLGLQGMDGHLSFGLHLEAGAQWTRTPAVEVKEMGKLWILGNPDYGTYATQTVQPSVGAWSIVAGGGVDLGWTLGPHFALHTGGVIYCSTINFPYTMETTGSTPAPIASSTELQQKIANYLVTLGLSYRLPAWY